MSQVEILEQTVKQLSPGELIAFRSWFAEFDAAQWDRQLKADSETGKLDQLAQGAIEEHLAGTLRAADSGYKKWRRERDLNPRYTFKGRTIA